MPGPLAFEGVLGSTRFTPVHVNESSGSLLTEGPPSLPKAGGLFGFPAVTVAI